VRFPRATRLIYLSLTTTTRGGQIPFSEVTLIVSSLIRRNDIEIVRYVALKIGESATFDQTQMQRVRDRGFKTLENVQALLTAQGLKWTDAQVTTPKEYTPLHADADPLRYDKAADCWQLPENKE
jgi:hypothetical protein